MRDSNISGGEISKIDTEYCKHGNLKSKCEQCRDEEIIDITDDSGLVEVDGEKYPAYKDGKEDTGVRRRKEIERVTGTIEAGGLSMESGRHPNEDTTLKDGNIGVIGVGDGMGGEGGQGSGKVASELSVGIIHNELKKIGSNRSVESVANAMRVGLEKANNTLLGVHDKVRNKAKDWFGGAMEKLRSNNMDGLASIIEEKVISDEEERTNESQVYESSLDGSKTTATIIALAEGENGEKRAVVGHAGDSRAYKLSEEGDLEQITNDHDNLYEAINGGLVNKKDIESLDDPIDKFPKMKAIIDNNQATFEKKFGMVPKTLRDLKKGTQEAIGKNNVKFDVFDVPANPGDIFMSFSDGVIKNVKDSKIKEIFADKKVSVQDKIKRVVELAKKRGVEKGGSADDDISGTAMEIAPEVGIDLGDEETEELAADELMEVKEDSKLVGAYRELLKSIDDARKIKGDINRDIVLKPLLEQKKELMKNMSDEEIVSLGLEGDRLSAIYESMGGNKNFKEDGSKVRRIMELMKTIGKNEKLTFLNKLENIGAVVYLGLSKEKLSAIEQSIDNWENNAGVTNIADPDKYNQIKEDRLKLLMREKEKYRKLLGRGKENKGNKRFGGDIFDDEGRVAA